MKPVFLVAGETAKNPGRSGIQTVVRSLAGAFGRRGAPVRLTTWNHRKQCLRALPPELELGPDAEALRDAPVRFVASVLGHPSTWPAWVQVSGKVRFLPVHRHPLHHRAPPGTWVLLAELVYGPGADRLVDYVHGRGWRLAAIFYDTIPVDRPDLVPPELPETHARYMRGLAGADLILPISEASANGWRAFLAREGLTGPPVRAVPLACDLVGIPRVRSAAPARPSGEPVRALCVSTLEPRKNHAALLDAYEQVAVRRPDLRLELDLVGASYVGAGEIADRVRAVAARRPGLRWHEQVEYARLRELYARCDFTLYPSVLEGFGLPVIESLWLGRPCVCANFGVMAENAVGGGCLTTDVRDPVALADAMLALANSPELRRRLSAEATARPLKTWGEYADELLACLESATGHLNPASGRAS